MDAQPPRSAVSFPVIVGALMGGLFALIIIVSLAVPFFMPVSKASNTRNASASLKTLTTAQADFRSNDRDGNLVNDFWTADVFGLYALIPVRAGSSEVPGDSDDDTVMIKLIEPSVAGADGLSRTGLYGNVTFRSSIVTGSTKAGYVCRAFGQDDAGTLWEDTDGSSFYGRVHNRTRFAYAAMPDTLSAGKLFFLVNADNTIWKYSLPGGYRLQVTFIEGATDSTSSVTGTGRSAFNFGGAGTGVFPADPAAIGCAKMD